MVNAFFQRLLKHQSAADTGFADPPIEDQLEIARAKYRYNYTHIPPLALLDTLPPEESFSSEWLRILSRNGIALMINTLAVNRGDQGEEGLEDDIRCFLLEVLAQQPLDIRRTVLKSLIGFVKQLRHRRFTDCVQDLDEVVVTLLKRIGTAKAQEIFNQATELLLEDKPAGRPPTLDGYLQLFQAIEPPAIAAGRSETIATGFLDDQIFSYLRVAGANPLMLQQIDPWSKDAQRTLGDGLRPVLGHRFPITEAQYQSVMGPHDSLPAAIREGRLYWIDYAILEGAPNGSFPEEQKYLSAPIALFAVPQGTAPTRQLQVVAIQCSQTPGPHNPVITPPGPDASEAEHYQWLVAKSIFQIADGNFHEAVSHLGRTHLLIEPFVLATHRQLPRTHPLNRLLLPHFQGTFAINHAAQRKLIVSGGGVDRLLGSTIDHDRTLAVLGLHRVGFNDALLPRHLKARGVDDPSALPVYPYRDDALLLWSAIQDWVAAYLGLYYDRDSVVQHDQALQTWAAELVAHDGGRLQGFGEDHVQGAIQTRAYLIDVITMVIFTASVQHAAVNFPQYDLMGYAPAAPLAAYVSPALMSAIQSEADFLQFLAPLDQAQKQLNLLNILSSVNYTKLGYYPEGQFLDPRVVFPLQQFQVRLKQIEATIQDRNQSRPPYNFLLPSRIPQSINI